MNRKGIKVISRYWMLNFLWFNISKPLGFKFPNHLRLLAAGLLKRMIIIQVTKLRYSLAALLCLFIEYGDWLAIFRTVISSVLIKTNWVDVKLINKTDIMVSSMSSIAVPGVSRMFWRFSLLYLQAILYFFEKSLRFLFFNLYLDINFYVHEYMKNTHRLFWISWSSSVTSDGTFSCK